MWAESVCVVCITIYLQKVDAVQFLSLCKHVIISSLISSQTWAQSVFYPHQSPVHRSGMWIVPAIIIQTLKWLMINNVVLEAWWPDGTIFVAMDHKPWATHGHGPNHVSGQNFALVAPTLETNDSQSLLMVISAHFIFLQIASNLWSFSKFI